MSSEAPLWWPPAKVAGRYLAPFIAARAVETNQPAPVLIDLDAASAADVADHRAAIGLAFGAADLDAEAGDYEAPCAGSG